MPETVGASRQEIKLFYCYAREDEALRDELHVNLAGLRRQYHITDWHDRKILPGEPWEEAIDKHLSTADVVLLLISPHFVDSDYCYGKEMQRALERHHSGSCCVIPVLLRPTYWEDTPFSTIQTLPTDARPITSWPDRYEAFHDVARGIGTTIKVMLKARLRRIINELVDKGHNLRKLKRYQEALAAFEQTISLDPNYGMAYSNKGHALNGLKRYQEALVACEQAIILDPYNALAYSNKGHALNGLKRYQEALAACEQAISLDPHDALAYSNKGHALNKLKRYREALAAFEQAIHRDSNDATAYIGKGAAFFELKRYQEALTAYEQAISLDRNDTIAYIGKDRALSYLKRYQEALTGMLEPTYLEGIEGHAEVRQVFKTGKNLVIAGCRVLDGKITRTSQARITHNKELIFDGKITSLRRGKNEVREVARGYECGIVLEDFNDFEVGDLIEAYNQEHVEPVS